MGDGLFWLFASATGVPPCFDTIMTDPCPLTAPWVVQYTFAPSNVRCCGRGCPVASRDGGSPASDFPSDSTSPPLLTQYTVESSATRSTIGVWLRANWVGSTGAVFGGAMSCWSTSWLTA